MKDYRPFIFFITLVLVIWVSSIFILPCFISTPGDRGLFGDSFGTINALFSGLAFAGIIATIIMQREELKLQREELKLTRKELKKSADAQDASQKALNLQVRLMTKQAVLNAYQTSLSTHISVVNSQKNLNIRDEAFDSISDIKKKIDELIGEIEKELE